MSIKSIFINVEPRLRAGWRLLIQTVLFFLLVFCFGVPISLITFLPDISISFELLLFLDQVITLVAVTLSILLARRFIDKRSFTSLGLQISLKGVLDLFVGVAIPLVMMGLIFGIELVSGWLTLDGFAWQSDSIFQVIGQTFIALVIFVLVGWNEELLYRGYVLQNLSEGLNRFWGVLISSIVFGLMHLGNPNSDSKWFVASGIFLAGVFLAFGYLRTNQLWLPIGLHIGWNFFEGVVFGFPVSGLDTYRLTQTTIQGPPLWTGDAFGPEAGLVLIPALVVGMLLIYLYTRKRSAFNMRTEI
jgi:membrane protease YdiL (CAAX protease family)